MLFHTSSYYFTAFERSKHYLDTQTLSHMSITFIYTYHQPIFQGRLNTHHKLQSYNHTHYIITCRPKQCQLGHSMYLNQHLKHETLPRIMPRTSATWYNHHVSQEHEEYHQIKENHQQREQQSMWTTKTDRKWSRNIHKHHELP